MRRFFCCQYYRIMGPGQWLMIYIQPADYTPATLCSRPGCNQSWLAHESLRAIASSSALSLPATPIAASSSSLPQPSTSSIQPWCPPIRVPNPTGTTNSRRVDEAQCHAPMPAFANPVTTTRINVPRDGSVTAQQAAARVNACRTTNVSAFAALQNMSSCHLANSGQPAKSGKTNRINGPIQDSVTGQFLQKFLILILPIYVSSVAFAMFITDFLI